MTMHDLQWSACEACLHHSVHHVDIGKQDPHDRKQLESNSFSTIPYWYNLHSDIIPLQKDYLLDHMQMTHSMPSGCAMEAATG